MIGLTYIMKLEDVTGKELSEKLGVSAAAVSQWEKKVRPIPQSRMPLLSMIFPTYPSSLFGKELDDKDMLKLQEAKLNHLKTLSSEDDAHLFERYNQKRDVELKLDTLIERDKLIKRISNLFEATENLETDLTNVIIFRSFVKLFADFCNIEEEILKNHINRNKNNRVSNEEVFSYIKKLSQDLEYQVGFTEQLFQYSNNKK